VTPLDPLAAGRAQPAELPFAGMVDGEATRVDAAAA
jgi:hypothetical protein